MVAGVGLGTTLAINGACAHAFAHILYKGLLFMGCGSVLHMTGKSKFTDLGGLYQKMPWTFLFTLIGGLSISAFPLFSGFVSKSMIVQAGFEDHKLWVGFLLLLLGRIIEQGHTAFYAHTVTVPQWSILHAVFGATTFPVNSMHIVANKAWAAKNPAAARLFAVMKLPNGSGNAPAVKSGIPS